MGAHRLEVQHAVLRLLQQGHELGGEQAEALLVPAGGLRLERVPQRPQLGSARRLELHHPGAAGPPARCSRSRVLLLLLLLPALRPLPAADRALHPRRESTVYCLAPCKGTGSGPELPAL